MSPSDADRDPTDGPPLRIDRRAELRVPTNTPARLFYGERFTRWIDCVVMDRSTSGAKVQVPAIFQLPSRLILLDYREGVAYTARRRWRKGDLGGLRLEARHDLRALQAPGLEAVHEAWLALEKGMRAAPQE
ncbi:MAG TPA: hypothetical protein VLI41_13915 [Phenylobacterium sp.]|uniref:hypothetical protein n=1 Tax=Phenylobacterium sp. TaxID=1871053 RepID=UPI002C4A97A6|nr:hypothetical protein [Phenylobacterium sp.]HSV04290.1 hypothetical protein [Phenylobacterium sp.]